LVTGASGHLGGVLVRTLLQRGRSVRALVHDGLGSLEGLEGDLELVPGDVLDPASLQRACKGTDSVFHLAAIISIVGDPDGQVRAVNVDGTRNVAEAALAAGARRMVHVSSVHAYDLGNVASQVDESGARVAADAPAYDRSKAAGEAALREVIARGLDAVIVNPSGILGPFDFRPSRMGALFLQLAARKLPALVPGGFSWGDVRDVVASTLAAEQRGRTGENYLLSGPWCSMSEVAEHAAAVTGARSPAFTVPMWLARAAAPCMTLWASLTGAEPLYTSEALDAVTGCRDLNWEKAATELGHSPRPVHETIRDVYRCFGSRGLLVLPEERGGEVAL